MRQHLCVIYAARTKIEIHEEGRGKAKSKVNNKKDDGKRMEELKITLERGRSFRENSKK